MSDLGLHCLPMSHKKDARLILVDCGVLIDVLLKNKKKVDDIFIRPYFLITV